MVCRTRQLVSTRIRASGFTVHCPPAVGAIDDISPSVAVTEIVPTQPIIKDHTTAPGPPSRRAGTEVLRIASHDESAEQDRPRMDMNPKLRVSNGRLPSRLNVTSSFATRHPRGFVTLRTTVVSPVVSTVFSSLVSSLLLSSMWP